MTPSGHCVDLRALAVDTERLRTQMSVEASSGFSAAVPSSSFGLLRQIDAGLLNVGYVDIGPAEGPVVVLLHGWPYDIHSYLEVCPGLAEAGYRVIVPYLRGFGTTRFLSDETFRNGGLDGRASGERARPRRWPNPLPLPRLRCPPRHRIASAGCFHTVPRTHRR